MAAGGGRSAAAKFGRHSGENRRFPAAGAAADLGGGLGRDAEAEPNRSAALPTRCFERKARKDHYSDVLTREETPKHSPSPWVGLLNPFGSSPWI
ncbi:hypothetical protein L3X38_018905 [Prunus dulcis]|uniref:Uncharacterized protein n=1 Tax=Prunus dulcis TaxID=3755 RepID=A0AAD4WA34_PRUDU|nr:hypothetical protein L3X38_018905 [Prunus dulcis]